MLLLQIAKDPILFFGFVIALIIAITFHEFSHALTATLLGDPTPKIKKRLTLNPLSHLDPLGTLVLFIANIGWGKPVPYNPSNLRRKKIDELLIAISGPFSNLIIAFIFALPYRISVLTNYNNFDTPFMRISSIITELNLILLIFNLIPIPPLDGSKFLYLLISSKYKYKLEKYSSSIIIGFLLFIIIFDRFTNYNILATIITPILSWLSYLVRTFPASIS